ncbi:MAG: pseudouridine-5'-phosphate glycosidase [Trueperaceae bacterium]
MIDLAPHVAEALGAGRPVVALESTVLTHGLPRPANLELALRLERVVAEGNALPATVGVVDGRLRVGLDAGELERLATEAVDKASPWNLGAIVARAGCAGTTVATTLHAAAAAGIEVFATGGIGGVHREAYDESADLAALARYPVITVSAGPKSVLDAAATLERLETLGVPVVGWRSDQLAGFHVGETDLPLPARADTLDEIAAAFRAHRTLGLPGGMLVSQPVNDGIDPATLRAWVEGAQADARARGVRGKGVTPALLAALAERSGGETVAINLRLLEANARLAAAVAGALAGAPAPGTTSASTSPSPKEAL